MERIKATFRPGKAEEEEATIIEILCLLPKDESLSVPVAIWIDSEGNIWDNFLTEFKVDMDSFTGRTEKQKTSALVEMLYHAFVSAKE